jgi:hypothetical protein
MAELNVITEDNILPVADALAERIVETGIVMDRIKHELGGPEVPALSEVDAANVRIAHTGTYLGKLSVLDVSVGADINALVASVMPEEEFNRQASVLSWNGAIDRDEAYRICTTAAVQSQKDQAGVFGVQEQTTQLGNLVARLAEVGKKKKIDVVSVVKDDNLYHEALGLQSYLEWIDLSERAIADIPGMMVRSVAFSNVLAQLEKAGLSSEDAAEAIASDEIGPLVDETAGFLAEDKGFKQAVELIVESAKQYDLAEFAAVYGSDLLPERRGNRRLTPTRSLVPTVLSMLSTS